jgi:hypothetical protein
LAALGKKFQGPDIAVNLGKCESALNEAQAFYAEIATTGYPLDAKSNSDHIPALREGIQIFRELVEL